MCLRDLFFESVSLATSMLSVGHQIGLKDGSGSKSENTLLMHLFVALATLAKRVCTSPYLVLISIEVKVKSFPLL